MFTKLLSWLFNKPKKVYILINSNAEGYNFKGIYDTLEEAQSVCDKWNKQEVEQARLLFLDDPTNAEESVRFYWAWDKVTVLEYKMNTCNFPRKQFNPDGSYID